MARGLQKKNHRYESVIYVRDCGRNIVNKSWNVWSLSVFRSDSSCNLCVSGETALHTYEGGRTYGCDCTCVRVSHYVWLYVKTDSAVSFPLLSTHAQRKIKRTEDNRWNESLGKSKAPTIFQETLSNCSYCSRNADLFCSSHGHTNSKSLITPYSDRDINKQTQY